MKYERIGPLRDGAWVLSSRLDALGRVDAVVFDCDGVLVDTRCSYDETILKVADTMLCQILSLRLPWRKIGPPLIRKLRRTGGFNNDWNATYALIVFSALSLPLTEAEEMMILADAEKARMVGRRTNTKKVVARLFKITESFISSTRGIGYEAVEEFIGARRSNFESRMAEMIRNRLGYPGNPPSSTMATLFDELYHGPDLFVQMYGFGPRYYQGRGMIDREKITIHRGELRRLAKMLGRNMAIVTGRPFMSVRYSLEDLLDYFDPGASVFIGDADVHPEIASDYERYLKPSGFSLVRAMRLFSSDTLLYVGDSEEDRMMVEDAKKSGGSILFAGIYGTVTDEREQVKYLKTKDADLILRSANDIPRLLEMARD